MKSVSLMQAYEDPEGTPTLEFKVTMKSVHDAKGIFSIAFMLLGRDNPQLMIFDDDRKILGVFQDKKSAIDFLNCAIKKRKWKHRINYIYPITEYGSGYLVGEPSTYELEHHIDDETLEGLLISKDVLLKGKLPTDKIQKWRLE